MYELENKQINIEKFKEQLENIDFESIWIVTFRTPIVNESHYKIALASGRFFRAYNVEDAIEQFTEWANRENLTTQDVYAVSLEEVLLKQKLELLKHLEYLDPEKYPTDEEENNAY